MNREIILRGKSLSNNSWETGFYFMSNGHYFIQWAIANSPETWCEIDEETIGQFTGLLDKNGKKIFEGDIVLSPSGKPMVISWNKKFASFCLDRKGWAFSHWFGEACDPQEIEIIGNIHENPELLERGLENG